MASDDVQKLNRPRAALSGVLLILLGVVFQQLLVRNESDNAYLWIALVGFGLDAVGLAFLLAGAVPASGVRTGVVYLGLGFLWLVGGLGLLLLVFGAVILLLQPDLYTWASPEFMSHVVAALLLAGTLYFVGLRTRSGGG